MPTHANEQLECQSLLSSGTRKHEDSSFATCAQMAPCSSKLLYVCTRSAHANS